MPCGKETVGCSVPPASQARITCSGTEAGVQRGDSSEQLLSHAVDAAVVAQSRGWGLERAGGGERLGWQRRKGTGCRTGGGGGGSGAAPTCRLLPPQQSARAGQRWPWWGRRRWPCRPATVAGAGSGCRGHALGEGRGMLAAQPWPDHITGDVRARGVHDEARSTGDAGVRVGRAPGRACRLTLPHSPGEEGASMTTKAGTCTAPLGRPCRGRCGWGQACQGSHQSLEAGAPLHTRAGCHILRACHHRRSSSTTDGLLRHPSVERVCACPSLPSLEAQHAPPLLPAPPRPQLALSKSSFGRTSITTALPSCAMSNASSGLTVRVPYLPDSSA